MFKSMRKKKNNIESDFNQRSVYIRERDKSCLEIDFLYGPEIILGED